MFATPWGLPHGDLEEEADRAAADLECLRGTRVLVTGGTGFLGSWLVSSLMCANQLQSLGCELSILTRDPDKTGLNGFAGVTLIQGDVRSLPSIGSVDVIVHGAASSSAAFGQGDGEPRAMADTIYRGTTSVLELAESSRARVLFLSSGAVYGEQHSPIAESCRAAPDPLDARSAYGQAKRLAETLCADATARGTASVVVARLFAFVGPRLPMDRHYAAGNFLADGIAGRTIVVSGDGRPRRSYLYSGELPRWCWALLARGAPGQAYNVGSDEVTTIAGLAEKVARLGPTHLKVEIRGAPGEGDPPWYVPSIERARTELGLDVRIDLDDALRKSYAWWSTKAK